MTDARLIERWLPIAALGEESIRERRSMTALPPTYYLHVWWARRPLVASRAALLASIAPADADHKTFLRALGIHGDPVATKRRIDLAKKTGEDLGANPYGYPRAFQYAPKQGEIDELLGKNREYTVADLTAGGGSIPYEAVRLGFKTLANDLNPVAAFVLKATVELPVTYGRKLVDEFDNVINAMKVRITKDFEGVYPKDADKVDGYVWARTVKCNYCSGIVPLSPNWKLDASGTGLKLKPQRTSPRICEFEVVYKEEEQSAGTTSGGDATCPFTDCKRVIDGDEIKRQASSGDMGDQMIAIVVRHQITKYNGKGKPRDSWEECFAHRLSSMITMSLLVNVWQRSWVNGRSLMSCQRSLFQRETRLMNLAVMAR